MLNSEKLLNSKPLFISVEGGDGVGKTTQLGMLEDFLKSSGLDFVMTEEPGGTPEGDTLRRMIVEGDDDKWDGISEAFLYSTSRHEHVRKLIRPSIEAGKWVVCSRFADSTTVYQGHGRGISREDLLKLHDLAVGDTWPNLTIILDADPENGLNRIRSERASDRLERAGSEFHRRVREGFLQIAQENPNRCRVIDAIGTPEEVHQRILATIEEFIKAKAA